MVQSVALAGCTQDLRGNPPRQRNAGVEGRWPSFRQRPGGVSTALISGAAEFSMEVISFSTVWCGTPSGSVPQWKSLTEATLRTLVVNADLRSSAGEATI